MATGVMVGASLFSAYGQYKASRAQEKAERQNARYMREQAELNKLAAERELDIFERESEQFLGDQLSIISRSGVSLSGSALMGIADEKRSIMNEAEVIKITGQRNVNLANMRAQQSENAAKDTARIRNIQTIGSILNVGATYYDAERTFNKDKLSVASNREEFFSGARRLNA